MEFKYTIVFVLGIILAAIMAALSIFYKARVKEKEDSVKLANAGLFLDDKYYKKQLTTYYVFRAMLIASITLMIFATGVMLARPYYLRKTKEQKYNRDIILCLDISSSVDDLNLKLVKELEDTVRDLSGERIGIVIFNTTPVVLSPLTDDYEYTIEQLENIHTAIKTMNTKLTIYGDNWLYWNEYLYGGTLIGNELRGSSLIGDGLLGGLFAFPKSESERTRVIIFSTDNDPNGEGYVNLMEAAEYCKNNNTTVYGIGTKSMYQEDMQEMKEAVELTGGKFFLEERSAAFHEIVDEIEEKSENLTEGKTIVKLIESPEKWYALLVIAFILFVISSIVLRRFTGFMIPSGIAMGILLVFVFFYAVVPAHQFSKGPDLQIKKKSNLNAVFVIDNTVSMVAKDMVGERNTGLGSTGLGSDPNTVDMGADPNTADPNTSTAGSGGNFFSLGASTEDELEAEGTRLKAAKEDACAIVDELEGAQFSVISFNNNAMLLAPLSQDTDHVKNAIRGIQPPTYYYATGSSLDTPKELLLSVLKSAKNKADGTGLNKMGDNDGANAESKDSQKTAVFFISDGEITAENKTLSSYAELAPYIDGGIVMGYGTKDGSTMRVKNYEDQYEEIEDTSVWPFEPAVSVLDENNLKQIAGDLGLEYKNMSTDEVEYIVSQLKKKVSVKEEVIEKETGEEFIEPPRYYGFYFLIPFALLLMINAGYVVKEK